MMGSAACAGFNAKVMPNTMPMVTKIVAMLFHFFIPFILLSLLLATFYFKVSSTNASILLSKVSGHASASLSGTAPRLKPHSLLKMEFI
jgi:hypothetical protein